MTYWILTSKGTIIPRSTVRPLTKDEWLSQKDKDARDTFTKVINEKLGEFVEGDFTVENAKMEEPLFEDDRGPNDLNNRNDQD